MRTVIQSKTGTKHVSLNRRRAIRERCLNCSAWNHAEVENCKFSECALYPYRTGKGKQPPGERNKAIRAYCLWCCSDQPSEVRQCPSGTCSLYPFRGSKAGTPVFCPETSPATPFSSSGKVGSTNVRLQEAALND